jgi:hypothetical protein
MPLDVFRSAENIRVHWGMLPKDFLSQPADRRID